MFFLILENILKCIIVASGPSAKNFETEKRDDCIIIAVNGAIEWISHADHWFSLDPSRDNLKRAITRRNGVSYHCAGYPRHIFGIKHYERIVSESRYHANDDSVEYWLNRWRCVERLQTDKNKISTGNSAYGAINLALHFGCESVLLVGVDATTEQRIEGGFCNSLKHLPHLLTCANKQIKLYCIHDKFEQIGIQKITKQEYLNE